MPLFQAAWVFYLNNAALVLNSLALFYGLCGSWLILATQLRTLRAQRLLSSDAGTLEEELPLASRKTNRLFSLIGCLCLGLALLLSVASAQF